MALTWRFEWGQYPLLGNVLAHALRLHTPWKLVYVLGDAVPRYSSVLTYKQLLISRTRLVEVVAPTLVPWRCQYPVSLHRVELKLTQLLTTINHTYCLSTIKRYPAYLLSTSEQYQLTIHRTSNDVVHDSHSFLRVRQLHQGLTVEHLAQFRPRPSLIITTVYWTLRCQR